ncbi:MAG: M20/M25/M40 family metallo-hydrolase [Pseudomonadota bacterium]|nr:MAG: M20/M25/M40 family metallo-hydrolase [Pseudomonadota bacterium]
MRSQKAICRLIARLVGVVSLCAIATTSIAQTRHDISISLAPSEHRIEGTDTITFDGLEGKPVPFMLHAGLAPKVTAGNAKLRKVSGAELRRTFNMDPALEARGIPVEYYVLETPANPRTVTLAWSGEIYHPVEQLGEEYARSFGVSPGIISAQGVFLAGSSYWHPVVGASLFSFRLKVDLPANWHSVSQGRRAQRETQDSRAIEIWETDKPQEEIYLIAAPFTEYRQAAGAVDAMVFLREADPKLAQKYLDVTGQYIEMYRKLIGPYPYAKFALVENFWETGYGMPSFTLLGPKVIRLPFILHSSYPHEILHNWWGNGVYVDYNSGNWSEGLTSYLADHLIKEQRGQGVTYRRNSLQKYTDYVRDQKDFPLTGFRGRHSSVTEAVGYGKTLMLFHMLRLQLGDKSFTRALQSFYRRHQFTVAGFDDLAGVFADVSGQSLEGFFTQWVERSGAPSLRVSHARAESNSEGYRLTAIIEQTQNQPPYRLQVPIAVHLADQKRAHQESVAVDTRNFKLDVQLPARPVLLEVDPEFDVFRRLHRNEIPPAISQALGADRVLMVLPSTASANVRAGYRKLAESWQRGRDAQVEIRTDKELRTLPGDRAVWLFGWDNRFRPQVNTALGDYAFKPLDDAVSIEGKILSRADHGVVVLARNPANADQALAWVASDDVAAMPGLGRKLPHYGKYSYLGFTGDEPTNMLKGQWPVVNSPMTVSVAQSDGAKVSVVRGELATRAALAQLAPVFSGSRMMRDVTFLASEKMAGRGLGSMELDKAADYIAGQFRTAGLQPGGDGGSYFQGWQADLGKPLGKAKLRNIIGVLPGSNPKWAKQSVVVAAHYDHLGKGWPDVHKGDEGKVHHGADDNASGVAVLLELARVMAQKAPPERTVVFVAFTGEEADRLGSRHYVRHAPQYPADKVMAMLNLDTVGRLGKRNLLVLGTASAREWVHIFRGAGFVTGVPVRAVADDFGSSDQKSFHDVGVPAVQFFSGPQPDYHRPGDTADKVDEAGLVKVAAVLKEAVEYLAARPEPLHVQLKGKGGGGEPVAGKKSRGVSLGTVPDFAYSGMGVRLSGVSQGLPAEKVGLREGDVITHINGKAVVDLRGFSGALRALKPGDAVTVRYMRDGNQHSVTTNVVAR